MDIRNTISCCAIFIGLGVAAASATAGEFCVQVGAAADQVRTQGPGSHALLPDATTCQRAIEPGGTAWFCYWTHPLRDNAARAAFAEMSNKLKRCGSKAVVESGGPDVNHPDSYETARFTLNGAGVSLALKDKAALRSTLIFLRISPLSRD